MNIFPHSIKYMKNRFLDLFNNEVSFYIFVAFNWIALKWGCLILSLESLVASQVECRTLTGNREENCILGPSSTAYLDSWGREPTWLIAVAPRARSTARSLFLQNEVRRKAGNKEVNPGSICSRARMSQATNRC